MSDFERDFLNTVHSQPQSPARPTGADIYGGEKRKAIIFMSAAIFVMIVLGGAIVAKRIVTESQQKEAEVKTVLDCGSKDTVQYIFRDDGKFYSTSVSLDKNDIERSITVIGDYSLEDNKIKTTANSSSYDGGAYVEIEPYSVEMELTEVENQKYLKVGTDSMKCTEVTNETAEE